MCKGYWGDDKIIVGKAVKWNFQKENENGNRT